MPRRILCKVNTHDDYGNLDGGFYTVYDNNTFIHSSWGPDLKTKRRKVMVYKIENNLFFYQDVNAEDKEDWKCDSIPDHDRDDLLLIVEIEAAIEKKYIFGDDND